MRAQLIAGKSTQLNACLLAREATPVLFVSGGETHRARTVMPWITDVHVVPIMEARGLVRGAIEHTIASSSTSARQSSWRKTQASDLLARPIE